MQKHYQTAETYRIPLGQKIASGIGMPGNQVFPAAGAAGTLIAMAVMMRMTCPSRRRMKFVNDWNPSGASAPRPDQ